MSTTDPIWFTPPPRASNPPAAPERPAAKQVDVTIDGKPLKVPETMTILEACRSIAIDTPTLCYLENLTPVNVCRVCVVELEGARTLVPACSRKVEDGMVVHTDSERVRTSRRLVLELLGSAVDLSTAPDALAYIERYDAHPDRFGPESKTVAQAVKVDNELYVRDYSKCILCYKCVEACGVGCNLTLHVQDDEIVKVTSPDDHDVTQGNLCVKGRFGYRYVQRR